MDQREVTAIAGGVEGRGRFRKVFADDARVADLLVTQGQLVMGQADGPRLVRQFGVFEGAGMQGDGARLLAAREGDAAVKAPERR